MKQYTAGQLAEMAGVSSRTIRYYDQRGLLTPAGYSESGYRLYDEDSLLKIQQIVMLKFAGFSLEEIQLTLQPGQSLWERLEDQKLLLLQRIQQQEEIVALLGEMEKSDAADPVKLAKSMHLVRRINHSARIYRILKTHGKHELYPWEFDHMKLKPGQRVLDLGCGYGLIWRFSWEHIPENTELTLLDKWPKNIAMLQGFCEENKAQLKHGVSLHFRTEDMETAAFSEHYDHILMAYVFNEISNQDAMLKKISDVLALGGTLSVVVGSGASLSALDRLYADYARESCLGERIDRQNQRRDNMMMLLKKHFPQVEPVIFDNELEFSEPTELYQYMMESYQELTQELEKQGSKFVSYLRHSMEQNGPVTIQNQVLMLRCKKE